MDSFGEYFLFYGLTDFVLFSPGLKVWLLLVQDTFCLPLPRVLALDSFAMISVRKLIFFFPTSADGRSSHFRLRVLANHFGFYLLPSPGQAIWMRSQSTDSLTHFLYFLWQAMRNWPILLSCLNGHSFGWPANSNTEG